MLEFSRVLTRAEEDPYRDIEWETEDIQVKDTEGRVIYSCPNATFPSTWSSIARSITSQKYFRESHTSDERETSLKDIIERVVGTLGCYGEELGYFQQNDAYIFMDELRYILLHQMASFNSPVWFNLGVPGVEEEQCSACFINKIEDDMVSIMDLAKIASMIFKEGSGSGVNLSNLRGSHERVKGGGFASGPVSFMEGYDSFANVIMSGGKTRRSARMVILNADHPDIVKFIECKAAEEEIVEKLVAEGMKADFNHPESAYLHAKHQTGNNSVRVTDEFMQKVRDVMHYSKDSMWPLYNRVDGEIHEVISVRELYRKMAEAAWRCGDPGIQFHDHINQMNTCSLHGTINASNPCSEFMWLDDSACNLASINLHRFAEPDRTFDVNTFKHVVKLLIIAQDIIVDAAGYPTKTIKENSRKYRPLGLGYANLGGLLMAWGLPYDSDEGRAVAANITSLMTAQAYYTSMEIAKEMGPFDAYEDNAGPMEAVLARHYQSAREAPKDISGINTKAISVWQDVMGIGFGRRKSVDKAVGFRNCQATLIAPTGTIAFMMDCDTTGIEPDVGLQKYKKLVGGGELVYSNSLVRNALELLGYSEDTIERLEDHITEFGHLEGSELDDKHLPIFDCALPTEHEENPGTRSVSIEGHIKMIAAVQPFLSGAVSKTFNMPHEATINDVERTFLQAWESGLKCIAVYRKGSKMSEVIRVQETQALAEKKKVPTRNRPPSDLPSHRHKFSVGGTEGFIHPGHDPETGELIEVFIRVAKPGVTVHGLLDNYFILFSKSLQYGIPLEILLSHMEGTKFEPAGPTAHREIHMASSLLDYIAKWLRKTYLEKKKDEGLTIISTAPDPPNERTGDFDINANPCPECGDLLRKSGACWFCGNCAYSSGVCS